MAKKPTEVWRELVGFDEETWHALMLSRESMKTFQELADEAFRDLLHKYKRPIDLKAALRSALLLGRGRRHGRGTPESAARQSHN
jgi:hypothetical protein